MSLASSALQADSLTLCHLGSPYYVDLYLKKKHTKNMQAYSQKPWVQTPTLRLMERLMELRGWGWEMQLRFQDSGSPSTQGAASPLASAGWVR